MLDKLILVVPILIGHTTNVRKQISVRANHANGGKIKSRTFSRSYQLCYDHRDLAMQLYSIINYYWLIRVRLVEVDLFDECFSTCVAT
jgi:hypothetical protein